MSELIKRMIRNSLGKVVLIFLTNNFRYEGRLKNADDEYLELHDFKTNSYKLIKLTEIKEFEVKDE